MDLHKNEENSKELQGFSEQNAKSAVFIFIIEFAKNLKSRYNPNAVGCPSRASFSLD